MAYHESLGVSVDPSALTPRFPDTGLYEPDSERAEVGFDLEGSVRWEFVTLLAVRDHHGVHEGYEVFCRFGLELMVSQDLGMTPNYVPCLLPSRKFCSG